MSNHKIGQSGAAFLIQQRARRLSLPLLTGVVIASIIGGGAFNLPQNMARSAGFAAVIIAWIITFAGMLSLANTFRILADQRPDLKAGIYSYAKEGFGSFAGFEMAWGYWLSAVFGNVAFALLIMRAAGYFFPVFADGSNWPSIIGSSLLIWIMHFIVLFGVKRVAILNLIASVLNISALIIILIIIAVAAKAEMFAFDYWGEKQRLGSVFAQVKGAMLVTLWVFIGIEGAVVLSDRAANPSQVGAATLIGLGICTLLYFFLSTLPFGLMHQPALARLDSPSAAYVLKAAVGDWGAVFVIVSLLISLLSCWLAWTVLAAELPHEGAKSGVFPQFFAYQNRHDAAALSLWVSAAVMQMAIFVPLFAQDAWIWLISITGVMILPPYLASTAYLWRYSMQTRHHPDSGIPRQSLWTGVLGTVYALWLLYAAGPQFVLMSTILFASGLPIFCWARREHAPGRPTFTRNEAVAAVVLLSAAMVAVVLFMLGVVRIK